MSASMTTMAILNVKSFKSPTKPAPSLLPILTLPKGLSMSGSSAPATAAAAIAGAVFSTLSTCEPALAVQQIAEIAEGSADNRGLALLLPIIPAIAWVLFNILQPALNQLNRMRSSNGLIAGLGALGASSSLLFTPEASAAADVAAGDNRGQLLLIVVAPAILWVLYNILQPALNQLNRMRSE